MPSSGLSLTLIVSHIVGVEASSSKLTSKEASQLTFSAPVVSSRTCLVTVVVSVRASSWATARLPACAGGRGCGRPAWAGAPTCSRARRPRGRPRSARPPPSPRVPVGQRAAGDLFGQRLPVAQQAVEAGVGEAVGVPQVRLVDRLAARAQRQADGVVVGIAAALARGCSAARSSSASSSARACRRSAVERARASRARRRSAAARRRRRRSRGRSARPRRCGSARARPPPPARCPGPGAVAARSGIGRRYPTLTCDLLVTYYGSA